MCRQLKLNFSRQKVIYPFNFLIILKQENMARQPSNLAHSNDDSESYGHQFRLKYRKSIQKTNVQQKSRRISDARKEKLVTMVTKQNYRIKDAGKILGISYSTAKKIFTNFRSELRAKKQIDLCEESPLTTSSYCDIPENLNGRGSFVTIISSIAGETQNVCSAPYNK